MRQGPRGPQVPTRRADIRDQNESEKPRRCPHRPASARVTVLGRILSRTAAEQALAARPGGHGGGAVFKQVSLPVPRVTDCRHCGSRRALMGCPQSPGPDRDLGARRARDHPRPGHRRVLRKAPGNLAAKILERALELRAAGDSPAGQRQSALRDRPEFGGIANGGRPKQCLRHGPRGILRLAQALGDRDNSSTARKACLRISALG